MKKTEKDLALTRQDINTILMIEHQLIALGWTRDSTKELHEFEDEILRRYNKEKKKA